MWDIDALLCDYKNHSYITVDTEILIPHEWLTIDTEYAFTTDVNIPVILFELPDNQLYIADGNHRLYRAAAENVSKMNVIVIPQNKHLSYLFKCTEEKYYSVIDKLKNEGIFINNFNGIFIKNMLNAAK